MKKLLLLLFAEVAIALENWRMAWTEESIVAEFRKHITYWQDKLRLRDIVFDVRIVDGGFEPDESNWWCKVLRTHGGDNQSMCDYQIRRGMYANETQYDVWSTTAHELVHVMNWAMAYAFQALDQHFSASQLQIAKTLMKQGNEYLAYKWEDILVTWFAADAPPKTIPEAPAEQQKLFDAKLPEGAHSSDLPE